MQAKLIANAYEHSVLLMTEMWDVHVDLLGDTKTSAEYIELFVKTLVSDVICWIAVNSETKYRDLA